jgi:hypothetical protein
MGPSFYRTCFSSYLAYLESHHRYQSGFDLPLGRMSRGTENGRLLTEWALGHCGAGLTKPCSGVVLNPAALLDFGRLFRTSRRRRDRPRKR